MVGFRLKHFHVLLCYLDACSQERAIQPDVIGYLNMSQLLVFDRFLNFLVVHGTHSSRGTDITTLSFSGGVVSQYIFSSQWSYPVQASC